MDKTILLVDDVRMFLEIQREFLRNSPVQVVTAANGIQALEAVRSRRPDLIFMDFEMPEMDGAQCCRAIKSDPALASIPIIMITGRGDEASCHRCSAAGCDGFLTKPLARNQFLETAGRFVANIDRREHRRQTDLGGQLRLRGQDFPCRLLNVSTGGAFVAGECPGEIGRLIQLSFRLPDGCGVECQAKVVWVKEPETAGGAGFGVNFALLPGSTKDLLARFLDRAPGA